MRPRSVATLAVAAVAAFGLAPAAPALAGEQGNPCGYYSSGITAYYNHCGKGKVWVHVDKAIPFPDEEHCLGPGVTSIGGLPYTYWAYSVRTC